jgi:pimeloyl-ACP methyl ester carboxylesterase
VSAESPAVGRSIQVNGATLYVEEQGVGAPIILIHGGLSSGAMWDAVLPYLIEDFRVITPDSRGHGRSTNPNGELSYPQLADDVDALIAALGLVRPLVGGYSDGGQVALELGARHPEAASGLVVGGAYPDFVDSGLREVWKAFLGTDAAGTPDLARVDATLGEFAEHVKSQHPGGQEQWQALVQQTAPMWLEYAGLSQDDVGRISTPVLVFTGDRDDLISLDLTLAFYRMLPNAELGVCPSADHFAAMTPERAAFFAGMVRDFAARHSDAREHASTAY